MNKGFFITGTDTDVGKTQIALGLLTLLNDAGYSTAVMKPVSAGCNQTGEGLRNEDALALMELASVSNNYNSLNPYAFKAPIAPHIAAHNVNIEINIQKIKHHFDDISATADFTVVEGAGGWNVPINATQTMADIAMALNLPVILVVGMKLGCLNHAITTMESMRNKSVKIAGWVANSITPKFEEEQANIDTLKTRLGTPFLGAIPFCYPINLRSITDQLTIQLTKPIL